MGVLSFKNIKYNFTRYLNYILSLVLIFSLFNIMNLFASNHNIISLLRDNQSMMAMFQTIRIFFYLFLCLYIIYFSSFFIKDRLQELSIYSMLGLSTKEIRYILFVENIIIVFFSLMLSIMIAPIGYYFLQHGIIYLLNLKINSQDWFQYSYLLYDVKLFIFLCLMSYIIFIYLINKKSLVKLSNVKYEIDKPIKDNYILGVLGIVLILMSYYSVYDLSKMPNSFWNVIGYFPVLLATLLILILGSYLFVKYSNGLIINYIKKRDLNYVNSIVFNRLKINIRKKSNIIIVLSLLISGVMTLLCMSILILNYQNHSLDAEVPSVMEAKIHNKNDEKIMQTLAKKYDAKLSYVNILQAHINPQVPLTHNKKVASVEIVSEAEYKKLLQDQDHKWHHQTTGNNAYLITMYDKRIIPKQQEYQVNNINLKFTYLMHDDSGISMVKAPVLLVVSDTLFDKLKENSVVIRYGILNKHNLRNSKAFANDNQSNKLSDVLSSYKEIQGVVYDNSPTIILVGFVCCIILISVLVVLYFISVNNYLVFDIENNNLLKLGFSLHDLRQLLNRENIVIFSSPLVIGLINGIIFYLGFSYAVLGRLAFHTLGKFNLLGKPIVISIIIIVLLYSLMYILTIKKIYKDVNKNYESFR